MSVRNGYISCCPRCAQLFQSTRGDVCPSCGFRPAAVTATTWDEYLKVGYASEESQAALDILTHLRDKIKNDYARSSPSYNAQYERMQEEKAYALAQQPTYTPRCPTCGPPDIQRIKSFFVSRYHPVTLHCNNCGYEW